MEFRLADLDDIPQMMSVRLSVKENRLSDPLMVTEVDYSNFLLNRGRGWVCAAVGKILGFAIVDLFDNNVWALFVDPAFEKAGIGKQLHNMMLDWYFQQKDEDIWLSTGHGTRAEGFYKNAGW